MPSERAKAAQKIQLFLAKAGDVGETLGAGHHRKQAQEQDLIERVGHLARLAWVFEVIEMTQKNDRFVECRTIRYPIVHGQSPPANRESVQNQHFTGLSRTPSPDCPGRKHLPWRPHPGHISKQAFVGMVFGEDDLGLMAPKKTAKKAVAVEPRTFFGLASSAWPPYFWSLPTNSPPSSAGCVSNWLARQEARSSPPR